MSKAILLQLVWIVVVIPYFSQVKLVYNIFGIPGFYNLRESIPNILRIHTACIIRIVTYK